MLTFDDRNAKPFEPLKELVKKTTPDRLECGENNEHWVYVQRSTKEVVLVCKVTGRDDIKCLVKDAAWKLKLTPAQLSACWRGLVL